MKGKPIIYVEGDQSFFAVDKVTIAIERFQYFEPPEGYYLAFSGGKDSQTIYHLAQEAGVKFDAHYNLTTVDPPELVQFIKRNYPDVSIDRPKLSMWQLIETKGLPTRLHRWCCSILKEHDGKGRICVTGVRWAESNARSLRRPYKILTPRSKPKKLFNDNDEDRLLFENCTVKGKRVINPIIDWKEEDVWEYLRGRGLEYCMLYDEGFTRIGCIGCIGCPMADKQRIKEFERYPKYLASYKRAIAKFLVKYLERSVATGKTPMFRTPDEILDWWIYGKKALDNDQDQLSFEEFGEDEESEE